MKCFRSLKLNANIIKLVIIIKIQSTIRIQNLRKMHPNTYPFYPHYPYEPMYPFSHLNPYFTHPFDYNSTFHQYKPLQTPTVSDLNPAAETTRTRNNEAQIKLQAESTIKILEQETPNLKSSNQATLKVQPKLPKITKPRVMIQKEGRNANSNLLRMFFRWLQNQIQDGFFQIQSIIEKYGMRLAPKDFNNWFLQKKIDYRNYIRVPTIQKLFVEKRLFREHTKIMRILFKYFIQQEAVVSYLTSKKLRKGAMAHNFLSLRVIWKEILMSKPAALKR